MPEIYVDADACPVKREVLKVAERHGLVVYIVSNGGSRPSQNPKVHSILVPDGPDAADDWIAERITEGDVAITADILLAERCVKAQAKVLSPTGRPFTPDNIGNAVATRDLMTHLRETGEISGHNASFSQADRSRFLQALEMVVR